MFSWLPDPLINCRCLPRSLCCICLSACMYFCVCLPACLSACLPVCLPACLPVCLSPMLVLSRAALAVPLFPRPKHLFQGGELPSAQDGQGPRLPPGHACARPDHWVALDRRPAVAVCCHRTGAWRRIAMGVARNHSEAPSIL